MVSPAETARRAEQEVWATLGGVPDPELPVVSVVDLGIARAVTVSPDGRAVRVTITPTYSGCPAMEVIERTVAESLAARFADVRVETVLAPAWTTDWITAEGRRKLAEHGIAPPQRPAGDGPVPLGSGIPRACPQCGSVCTERLSEFGSTSCKALYRCLDCREPFDYVKSL